MSLSASMWTSVSGLLTHGEKMNIIGNNLANVSTVGFKAQRADFADFLYTDYGTTSGREQIGKGTGIAAIIGDFSQGSFESTNSGTDLAINGNGFFKVNDEYGRSFYTRAGDFYFNEKRELQNPSGLILQGWRVAEDTSVSYSKGTATISQDDGQVQHKGTVTDIVLDKWNLPPKATKNVTIADNLVNNDIYDKSTSSTSPLTALFSSWQGNKVPPISDSAYATQSSVAVYDESGSVHNLTVYMDKVKRSTADYTIEGMPPGYSMYEYLVTMDPSEDMRSYGGTYDPSTGVLTGATNFYDATGTATKATAGVLMTGVMIFDSSGQLVSQTGYTYGAGQETTANTQCALDPDDLSSWQATKFSNNGLPVFTANFTGKALANSVSEEDSENSIIELDFGLRTSGSTWDKTGSLADLAADSGIVDYNRLALMTNTHLGNHATTNDSSSFMTDIQSDGYAAGLLSNYNFTETGVLYGYYSNGENIPLYQLALYDFPNQQGLYREGGNLYTPTNESGYAKEDVPGKGTLGTISSYYIENSNVDMSREFVHMISTQRGFQANSKSITTTDTMLETVIGMKR
ncbi:MAG: flagellar hook-basal body complex protein [Desulfovibrio sp.]|nr:flagellar hook-basal body complex protein [Desulfovibrio sp.]